MTTTGYSTHRAPAFAAGALLFTLLLGCAAARAQSPSVYSLAGDEVAIYNLIGEARVVAGDGADVEVAITRAGAGADQLTIHEGARDGRKTLSIVYPGSRFVYPEMGRRSRTEIRVDDDGTFGGSASGGRRVTISGGGEGLEARADLTIRVPKGKRVRVYQAVGEVSARDIAADLSIDAAAAPVSVENVRGAVSVDVGSGAVRALGIDGDLAIDTGAGAVHLQDVRGSRIHIDTGSGEVTGARLSAPALSVDTGSGEVDLSGVETKDFNLDTGSGSVSIEIASDIESMAIDTGSGSVEIGLPPQLGADLYVETGSGDVRVLVPHTDTHRDEDSLRCRIGDGRGEIRVDTGSGDVSIVGG